MNCGSVNLWVQMRARPTEPQRHNHLRICFHRESHLFLQSNIRPSIRSNNHEALTIISSHYHLAHGEFLPSSLIHHRARLSSHRFLIIYLQFNYASSFTGDALFVRSFFLAKKKHAPLHIKTDLASFLLAQLSHRSLLCIF